MYGGIDNLLIKFACCWFLIKMLWNLLLITGIPDASFLTKLRVFEVTAFIFSFKLYGTQK
jgi:hypothetical protein